MSDTTKLAILPSVNTGVTLATDVVTKVAFTGPPGVPGAPGISQSQFVAATANLVTASQLSSALAGFTPSSAGSGLPAGVGTVADGGSASSAGIGTAYDGGNASST